MSRPSNSLDAQIEASLERIRGALEHSRRQYGTIAQELLAVTGAEVAERITARIEAKQQRRMDRWRERERRRREHWRRYDPADFPKGVVFAIASIVCLSFAIVEPEALWWMVFVAFGFAMSAAGHFGRVARRRNAEREDTETSAAGESTRAGRAAGTPAEIRTAAPQDPPDPTVARIQSLCDKLLAELESGPPIVREIVKQPEPTIGGLRQACLEIARRERELRAVLAAQDEARLVGERDALLTRLSGERDEIVRDRLGSALRALEQQLAHRAELATAATRLEAENMRIMYTLEDLQMQLLRARSTDAGAPELGGELRESLSGLGHEIDAVAEALEWASSPGSAGTPPPSASAASANAEREAAARRAAATKAYDSQRH